MQRVLDWPGTILYALVFAVILLFYDVALRLANLLGLKAVERVAVSLQKSLVASYRVVGASVSASTSPEIREGESSIIVSNHQSMFDIPSSRGPPDKQREVHHQKTTRAVDPSRVDELELGNHPLIDRDDRGGAVRLIADLGERVARGEVSAVIFPEADRNCKGQSYPLPHTRVKPG